jgi:membrane-bound lytic murein transglycosylase D
MIWRAFDEITPLRDDPEREWNTRITRSGKTRNRFVSFLVSRTTIWLTLLAERESTCAGWVLQTGPIAPRCGLSVERTPSSVKQGSDALQPVDLLRRAARFAVPSQLLRSEREARMTKRTLLIAAVLAGLGVATFWHQSHRPPTAETDETGFSTALASETVVHANPPAPTDSLSEAAVLRRLERLYRLQADLARAQAARDADRVERLLHTAIGTLGAFVDEPGLARHPRFRQVFRTLTNTYEDRYGVPDTLRLPNAPSRKVRRALTGASGAPNRPSIVDVLPTNLRDQNRPVPLPLNRSVRERMAFLLHHKQEYLYPWLRRAATYFPMIEQIFAEVGVPDELKYLALAESGLNPHAQSRAHAAGIWQFVAQTGRQYGLTIDPWVDERLDPEKSTRAAARHLKDLHEKFGSWPLALAGYNCNPGVVQYHVREYRAETGRRPSFWDIYDDLPDETRNYVPLFTATALIVSHPAQFDLRRVQAGPRYAFDYVPVEAALPIEQVARLAEVEPRKVRALNPELRSNRLPPSEAPYYVRLPYGTYSTFAANYAALPEKERPEPLQHVLQSGETAGRVAQRYHVDRSDLLAANEHGYPVTMTVGEPLTLPEKEYAGNARVAESAEHEPLRVQYGSRTVRPIAGNAPGADLTASLSSSESATP